MTLSFSLSAQATSLTEQQKTIDEEAASKQDEIKNKTTEAEALTKQKQQAYNEWKKFSLAVADLEVKIYEKNSELLQVKERISVLETKARESKERLDKRHDVLSKRLVVLQEQKADSNIVAVLLESESISDFFNRAVTVSYILNSDQDLIDSYEKELKTHTNLKKEAEAELVKMKKVQAELKQTKAELEAQQTKKNQLMNDLEKRYGWTMDNIQSLQSEYNQLEKKSQNLGEKIAQEKQQRAAEQKQRNNNEPPKQGKVASVVSSPSGGYDVRTISNVTPATLNNMLKGQLSGYGATFYEVGRSHGIDPAFLAAVAMAETGGTSNWLKKYNNVGGFISSGGPMSFSSIEDSIRYMGSMLTRLYLNDGLYTVEAIHSRYSPVGADTDPNNLNSQWVSNVYSFLAQAGVSI